MTLEILVIHGYVQSAATVAANTQQLQAELSDVATLHYVDGPPMGSYGDSRPWWVLGSQLQFDGRYTDRWEMVVKWWSDLLSKKQYDGVIGLSQGSAMAALLVAMVRNPDSVPGFTPTLRQDFKFAIMCSGFVSSLEPHAGVYTSTTLDIPSMHTVDYNDGIVPAQRTIALQKLFTNSQLLSHSEGHRIPVRGDWPQVMRSFILRVIPQSGEEEDVGGLVDEAAPGLVGQAGEQGQL